MQTAWGKNPGKQPADPAWIQAGSHNGDPRRFTQWMSKPVHTMEVQVGSHNGDPSHGDPKPGHRMEIQSRFTQWRSKPVHTMQIQVGPHNGDPSRHTSRTLGKMNALHSLSGLT